MKPKKELLFAALGGSGEIGMNANLYGCDGKWLMVDLGMSFGDPSYPGIDLIFPDIDFIEDRADDLLGIVLTHGHEDHIGAIPWLAADLGVPLYATAFTAGLIAGKLAEHRLTDEVELNVIPDGGDLTLGSFHIRYIPLAHSIAEGNALLIETPYGRIFHTGDWKLDDAPQIGTPATEKELSKIGDDGVLALVCDSTNVFNPNSSGSEGNVREALIEEIMPLTGRVVVTTFASNVARLQTLGEVSRKTNRKLCMAGRSLNRILANAQAHGYLKDFPETIDFEDAMNLPRNNVMILATGGQGEPRAALSRMADGNHPIKLEKGDHILFSSKQIPGNELAIGRIQNRFAEMGVDMITDKQADIHVSGHPGRPELIDMYSWIKPEILLPVHGEMRHMSEQAKLGAAQGIKQTIVQQNGDVVRLAPGKAKIIDRIDAGRLVLDGEVIIADNSETIAERRRMAWNGTIAVAVALDKKGQLFGEPQLWPYGVPLDDDFDEFTEDALDRIDGSLEKKRDAFLRGDHHDVRENIRIAVRRCARNWTGKNPQVHVQLITDMQG